VAKASMLCGERKVKIESKNTQKAKSRSQKANCEAEKRKSDGKAI
jgi:hypothetical protein